jgi:hypothetical protein
MNCALWSLGVCANVRVTGHKNAGVPVTPAIWAVSARARHNAERLLERGANYD